MASQDENISWVIGAVSAQIKQRSGLSMGELLIPHPLQYRELELL
ncbi:MULTISPECIES: hypothetical protein [unclassified Pseudomonas]|nr:MULTISPECIES: hypothetical protein [unclassified Pseudomonas]MEB0042932.1 hypothetical protein [Pseudomonas sp. MH10]MEB0121232.1 hypothetical protein [Pseudomonas sp. CCI1.2]WPX66633.1 hypothetical protein RHM59_11420 [Pseudomonas sp. MH10]